MDTNMAVHGMTGKAVVVTGGATGIGRAICRAFLDAGAHVVLADVDAARVELAPCDVSERRQVRGLVDEVLARWGAIDVLVNNAGIPSASRFEDLSEAEWDRVMSVNAKGAFLCSQAVLGPMRAAGGGCIVNMASQAAQRGQAHIVHYCASKAAVIGLTKALARECAPLVRVNAVAPGTVETAMLGAANASLEQLEGLERGALVARALAETPMGRLQSPESIAAVVAFLASDAARDVTGQTLSVSGGLIV